MTKLTNQVEHISVTVWARAKRRSVQSSPRGRDCEKCCFFRTRASWLCVNFCTFSIQISMTKLTNQVEHISVTVWARAKRRSVQSSPRGRDCEKCCLSRTRASWLCVNFSIQSVWQNWQMKWCISQWLCELELNGDQFRVHRWGSQINVKYVASAFNNYTCNKSDFAR